MHKTKKNYKKLLFVFENLNKRFEKLFCQLNMLAHEIQHG